MKGKTLTLLIVNLITTLKKKNSKTLSKIFNMNVLSLHHSYDVQEKGFVEISKEKDKDQVCSLGIPLGKKRRK